MLYHLDEIMGNEDIILSHPVVCIPVTFYQTSRLLRVRNVFFCLFVLLAGERVVKVHHSFSWSRTPLAGVFELGDVTVGICILRVIDPEHLPGTPVWDLSH